MHDAVQPDAPAATWRVTLRPVRLLMWPEMNPAAKMVETASLRRSARCQAAPPTSATVISPPPLGL